MPAQTRPDFVTITGVDDRTDLAWLEVISARFPVEWAVLYWPDGQGVHQRFPSHETIARLHALQAGSQTSIDLAAHLCGRHAKQVMKGEFDRTALELSPYRRIQVNHLKPNSAMLSDFAIPGQTVIAQWRNGDYFLPDDVGHQWLYDPSGGRGQSPTSWPINPTSEMRGYAGGIGPHNVADVTRAVSRVSQAGFWLDMETGVRTDDWLDLALVEQVLAAVYG